MQLCVKEAVRQFPAKKVDEHDPAYVIPAGVHKDAVPSGLQALAGQDSLVYCEVNRDETAASTDCKGCTRSPIRAIAGRIPLPYGYRGISMPDLCISVQAYMNSGGLAVPGTREAHMEPASGMQGGRNNGLASHFMCLRSSWAFSATMMVLRLIKTAPAAGPRTMPCRYNTPAAKGMARALYPVAQIRFWIIFR